MGLWPTEVRQYAVAQVLRYVPTEARDRFCRGAVIVRHEFAKFLGVEVSRNFGRANQIAEQHRQMASLAAGFAWLDLRCLSYGSTNGSAECSTAFTAEFGLCYALGAAF
jgi:hypothetical protein